MQIPLTETHLLVLKQSPLVSVCLSGCLWLPVFAGVCFLRRISSPCGCTLFQYIIIPVCMHGSSRVNKYMHVCMCVVCVCTFLLPTVWLTAAINRIKSKWLRAPSWSLQSPPSQGRGGRIQKTYGAAVFVCVCVSKRERERVGEWEKDINVRTNTEDTRKWTRVSECLLGFESVIVLANTWCVCVCGWLCLYSYYTSLSSWGNIR